MCLMGSMDMDAPINSKVDGSKSISDTVVVRVTQEISVDDTCSSSRGGGVEYN